MRIVASFMWVLHSRGGSRDRIASKKICTSPTWGTAFDSANGWLFSNSERN